MGASLKKYLTYSCLAAGFLLLLAGCRKDDIPRPPRVSRTVLVYMAAENTLDGNAGKNIEGMLAGMSRMPLLSEGGNLLVYLDPESDVEGSSAPRLYRIGITPEGIVSKETVSTYPEHNSASPEVLSQVIGETCNRYPADEYGLILWSHGTGWLPANSIYAQAGRSAASAETTNRRGLDRAFGQDGREWMELDELASALPDDRFDFIVFDARYMGNGEGAYALRDKTDYLIGAPTEILSEGMPYEKIVPYLFSEQPDLPGICRAFYDYYTGHPYGGVFRSATISLIRTDELENLAGTVRGIIASNPGGAASVNVSSLQRFDRFRYPSIFDMGDYLERFATPEQLADFQRQMARTVPCCYHTPIFINYEIRKFSGMGMYVPQSGYPDLNASYERLEWAQAIRP